MTSEPMGFAKRFKTAEQFTIYVFVVIFVWALILAIIFGIIALGMAVL